MSDHAAAVEAEKEDAPAGDPQKQQPKDQNKYYRLRFRSERQVHSAYSRIQNLKADEVVMVQTDHGPEPAKIMGNGVLLPIDGLKKPPAFFQVVRRASRDEMEKYENLIVREQEAYDFCCGRIEAQKLVMKLIHVERYFNGSKVIFYFTAENRVDFRALVKELVQEFRTRVEMRQIGVRHETQMLGGIGCCGRELCCNLFMQKFVPVSIKMAKEQDLPLNPSKISGACNRLLCCLTHEFETYRYLKRDMPKVGKQARYKGQLYKVTQNNTLKGSVTLVAIDGDEVLVLDRSEWKNVESVGKQAAKQGTKQPGKQAGKQKNSPGKQKAEGKPKPKHKPRAKAKGSKKTKA